MRFNKILFRPKWIVLVLVIVIPAIASQLVFDKRSYKLVDTDVKNILEIGAITILAVLGNIGVKDFANKWSLNIWRLVYVISIVFLIVMALIQAFIYQYTTNNQYRFTSIKLMLFSPMVYVILLILENMKLKKVD